MTDKRKRAAPTIDLTATEVSSAPDETASAQSPEPAVEQETAAAREAAPPPDEARTEKSETPADESAVKEETPAGPAEAPPPPQQPPSRGGFGAVIMAGIAGAVVALGAIAAVWYGGFLPTPGVDMSGERAQIATLQKQIDELRARPAPAAAAADSQAVAALRQRLGKLEQDISKLPPDDATVARRLDAADSAMKSLGVALAALNRRSDDIAAKATQAQEAAAAAEKAVTALRENVQAAGQGAAGTVDAGALEALQKKLAALEQSLVAARDDLAKQNDALSRQGAALKEDIAKAADVPARRALAADALRDAVMRGAPFQAELAQAKALGVDDKTLAPLESLAAQGVPSEQALAQELAALLPALSKTAGDTPAAGGFLARLQANASKLVRVTPLDAPAGDDPAAILARLEVAAAQADIEGALADIGKLPEKARQQAAAWVTKAAARRKAVAAARQAAADASRALGAR